MLQTPKTTIAVYRHNWSTSLTFENFPEAARQKLPKFGHTHTTALCPVEQSSIVCQVLLSSGTPEFFTFSYNKSDLIFHLGIVSVYKSYLLLVSWFQSFQVIHLFHFLLRKVPGSLKAMPLRRLSRSSRTNQISPEPSPHDIEMRSQKKDPDTSRVTPNSLPSWQMALGSVGLLSAWFLKQSRMWSRVLG